MVPVSAGIRAEPRLLCLRPMKAYVTTSGSLFGLIALANVARIFAEGTRLARDPWFLLLTVAAAGLCGWAVRLVWRAPRG